MSGFVHGVEVAQVEVGGRSVRIVKTAVVALPGIAPTGPKNQLVYVSSETDAAQFGKQLPGFTIPQTLDIMIANGVCSVLVVNVFDEAIHTTQVTDEAKTVVDGVLKLDFAPIGNVTIKDNAGSAVAYVNGTDYSIDEFGNFRVLNSTIASNTALKFSYKKLNISAVTGAHIVGEVNAGTGVRTGMKLFDQAFNDFGFTPKIIIAPGFSTLSTVATEIRTAANKFRALGYQDAPVGTTVANAIAGRGPSGTINFNTSEKRIELLFPNIKKTNPDTGLNVNFAYSAYAAAVRAYVDSEFGWWYSSSNYEIKGAAGSEIPISANPLNPVGTDANNLNEAGITTVFNTFGSGLRTWGNFNASYPTNTAANKFTSIQRIDDIVNESLILAWLPFADKPLNPAIIDAIRESGNEFLRILAGRGAVLQGSTIIFDKASNSPTDLSDGKLRMRKKYMGPTPAQTIIIESELDISLYKNVA